jgi:hypothetical protein
MLCVCAEDLLCGQGGLITEKSVVPLEEKVRAAHYEFLELCPCPLRAQISNLMQCRATIDSPTTRFATWIVNIMYLDTRETP